MTPKQLPKHFQHRFSMTILNTSQLAKCGPPVLWRAWGLSSWTQQQTKQSDAKQFWRLMHWCNINAHLQSTNSSTPTAFKGKVQQRWGSDQESTSRRIYFDLKPSTRFQSDRKAQQRLFSLSLSPSLSFVSESWKMVKLGYSLGMSRIRIDQGFVTNMVTSYQTLLTSDLKLRTWTYTFNDIQCAFIILTPVTPVTITLDL